MPCATRALRRLCNYTRKLRALRRLCNYTRALDTYSLGSTVPHFAKGHILGSTEPHFAALPIRKSTGQEAALAPPMACVWLMQKPCWPRDFRAPGGRPDRYLPRLDGQIGPGCAYIVT